MSTTSGFKFQPNDEEIIRDLENKPSNPCQTPSSSPIKDCPGFYVTHPRHLPDANGIKEKKALYYYVRTKKKSRNGDRMGPSGFWRASGNNKILSETGSEIGYRRPLKYFEYSDENHKSSKSGKSTNWMMHEYRLATTTGSQSHEESLEHWTICKVTWTGKNFEVTNDFSREGSIGPSENKHKNELTAMHTQNEGDPKISKIVDSKQEEIAQTNYHSVGDKQQFERWTKEKRCEHRDQRMNREIRQPEEISPSYAFGIHPTPNIMATTHEVETAAEPQRFTNPGRITGEFEPSSFPEQTYASSWHRLNNSKFTGTEDGIQSRNPSWPEVNPSMLDLPSLLPTNVSLYSDFTEGNMESSYGTLPGQNPTSQLLGYVLCSDFTWSKDQNQPLYPDFTEGNMESSYGTLPGQNPTSQLLGDVLCSDSTRSKDQNQPLYPDFTEGNMESSYGTLPGQNPTSQLLGDVLCSDSSRSKDQNQPLYPDFTEGNMESSYGTLPGQNPTSQLPGDRFLCSDSTRSKDQNQSLFYPLPTANHPGMEHKNLQEANLLDKLK